jgi:hypothetical protein
MMSMSLKRVHGTHAFQEGKSIEMMTAIVEISRSLE